MDLVVIRWSRIPAEASIRFHFSAEPLQLGNALPDDAELPIAAHLTLKTASPPDRSGIDFDAPAWFIRRRRRTPRQHVTPGVSATHPLSGR